MYRYSRLDIYLTSIGLVFLEHTCTVTYMTYTQLYIAKMYFASTVICFFLQYNVFSGNELYFLQCTVQLIHGLHTCI